MSGPKMYDTCKELNRQLNIISTKQQLKTLWHVVVGKKEGKEWYDSTAKEAIAMQARTTTEMWALHPQDTAKALDEATRMGDEGFWTLGSVGSSSC